MRKFLSFFVLIFMGVLLYAQAPQKFTYQAVVRDAGNSLVSNHSVSVRVSILQGDANGVAVYVENQSVTTNANGLMTLSIGDGTIVGGDIAAIDWANGPYFLKTETDPTSGTNYTIVGTQQLLSVPYALYANKAANSFSGDYNDLTNTPQIPTVPTNVSAFINDAGYVTSAQIPTVPTNVGAFENDVHYITEAQLNAILVSLNYTIDSLRERITALETLPPTSGSVTTSQISGITEHTAVCGGEVLTDGGSAIMERGVCWSTSHNPTVNNSHTIDGAGTGTFTSTLTGLAASTTYYVRAYVVNSVGIGYGGEVSFTTLTDPCQGVTTVTDYDGNVYNTIGLGNQCWMKENLRSTHYFDGTPISQGSSTSSSTRYYYNPGASASYGYLYNWPAVKGPSSVSANNQGVCPNGWHVPSDGEWTELTQYLGSQSGYCCSSSSSNVAKALASTTGWSSSSTTCAVGNSQSSNNATCFGALPAGNYYSSGYTNSGNLARFWSATESSSSLAYFRALYSNYATVNRANDTKSAGYSVRCLRD